jgi:hypothetical protein
MLLPEVGAVLDSLPALGVTDDVVDGLRKFLDSGADEVEGAAPGHVADAFGSSPASTQCLSDAQKARAHVNEALLDMGAALRGYGTVVKDLHRNVTNVDDATYTDFTQKVAAADACVAPSFAATPQCTLPTDGSGSGD